MSIIRGTNIKVGFSRIVDGDTIRIFLPDQEKDESIRILALDTEESFAGGSKPVSPWGHAAKARAAEFFDGATEVTIEFPGNESVAECVSKYRGNFGRLLCFVYRDGVDFQETMIAEGFSPYFMKYGNAQFSDHHQRYSEAERIAQLNHVGVWDQQTVNGSQIRNYAALGTWWKLRARIIDEYRILKSKVPALLNTRLDYDTIVSKANAGEEVTIFTELSGIRKVGPRSGLISYGGQDRPFNLYLPDIESDVGQQVIKLMQNRYISDGETSPRRSYAYVSGVLSLFRERPQMAITTVMQISDDMPSTVPPTNAEQQVRLIIKSLLANPEGADRGNETVTLKNVSATDADLTGWVMQDLGNHQFELSGQLNANDSKTFKLPSNKMPLNNSGDEVFLFNAEDELHDHVSYTRQDVVSGEEIVFEE